MKPERPVPITALGALCLFVGAFGVVAGLCGLALAKEPATLWYGSVTDHPLAYLRDRAGYRAYEVGLPIALGATGAAFLVTGAGLLATAGWARKLANATAVVALTLSVLAILFEVGAVLPVFDAWRSPQLPGNTRYRDYPLGQRPWADEPALNLIPVARLTAVLVFVLHGLIVVTVLLSPASRAEEGDPHASPHRA